MPSANINRIQGKTKAVMKTVVSLKAGNRDSSDVNKILLLNDGEFPADDVLPEAILVKNILDEAINSSETILRLRGFDFRRNEQDPDLDPRLERLLSEFFDAVEGFDGEFDDVSYDGDTEVFDSVKSNKGKKRFKTRKSSIRRKFPLSSSVSSNPLNNNTNAAQRLEACVKKLVLLSQNDRKIAFKLRNMLAEYRKSNSDFIEAFGELRDFAKSNGMTPQIARVMEIDALCNSVLQKIKYEKIANRLKGSLEGIESLKEAEMAAKSKEKDELDDQIKTLREETLNSIREHKSQVNNRIRVMSWNSNARQTKSMEYVSELKRELEEAVNEHVTAETNMRHANIDLENEIQEMIDKFDKEMFQRHDTMERIKSEYKRERAVLKDQLDQLSGLSEKEEAILEEYRLEEAKQRENELQRIRMIVAAKSIQRGWRQYKTRMLLKKKKRKKKHHR